MVCGGVMGRGGAIVCSGSWWFMMVCGGVMVYGGAIMVHDGLRWCDGSWWCVVNCGRKNW